MKALKGQQKSGEENFESKEDASGRQRSLISVHSISDVSDDDDDVPLRSKATQDESICITPPPFSPSPQPAKKQEPVQAKPRMNWEDDEEWEKDWEEEEDVIELSGDSDTVWNVGLSDSEDDITSNNTRTVPEWIAPTR